MGLKVRQSSVLCITVCMNSSVLLQVVKSFLNRASSLLLESGDRFAVFSGGL